MARKKISIGSWSFAGMPERGAPPPFEALVPKLKALGFEGIELGGGAPNPDDCPDGAARYRLRDLVEDAGLEFSAYVPDLKSAPLISRTDIRPYLDAFEKHLRFARDLGITMIRVDTLEPISKASAEAAHAAFDRVAAAFREVSRRAADDGLRVAWEFEPGRAFHKPSEIVALLDAVAAPNFGVLFDTAHAEVCARGGMQHGTRETLAGGAAELLTLLKGRIVHLHLNDSNGQCHRDADGNDVNSARLPLGEGTLDFDALAPLLLSSGVPDDWWVSDLPARADAETAAARNLAFLQQLRVRHGAAA